MVTVHVVVLHDWDNNVLLGVFASREAAEEFISSRRSFMRMSIEEWDVQS